MRRALLVFLALLVVFAFARPSFVVGSGAPSVAPEWYYYCYPPYYYCPGYGYPYWYWYYGYSYKPVQYELTLKTNPADITTTTGTGKYNQGTTVTFSVSQTLIPHGDGARYVFTHWSGDYSSNSPSGAVLMDRAKTILANYRLEYFLKVNSEPAVAAATGDGWYPAETSASPGEVPQTIEASQGSRYLFTNWKLDGLPVAGNPPMVTMDAPHTVTASYRQQFYLKLVSPHGTPYGEGWYDAGSSAVVTIASPIDVSFGVSLVFDHWEGDFTADSATAVVRMDAAKTVVAVWRQDSAVLNASIGGGVAALLIGGVGVSALVFRGRQQSMRPPRLAESMPSKKSST